MRKVFCIEKLITLMSVVVIEMRGRVAEGRRRHGGRCGRSGGCGCGFWLWSSLFLGNFVFRSRLFRRRLFSSFLFRSRLLFRGGLLLGSFFSSFFRGCFFLRSFFCRFFCRLFRRSFFGRLFFRLCHSLMSVLSC